MRKFSCCWIPDFPDESLAGNLISFSKIDPAIKMEYVGSLSRFKPSDRTVVKYDVTAIFSGPEPQRTILENIVLSQLKRSPLTWFAVRGLPSDNASRNGNISDFMDSAELQQLIESSRTIIARSGYSTIMDLSALGKKAIFIPTPGQTEQEYLATKLMKMNVAFSMPQHKFDLTTAMETSRDYSGFKKNNSDDKLLNHALEKFLQM
jgi:UDP-N-acetylglucosamine transferase subunit ALG13